MYLPSLRRLIDYDVIIVCDDSGSMAMQADDDDPNLTRWAELKQSVRILLGITEAMGKAVDVYFINRGAFRQVRSWNQIANQFNPPPAGFTDTVSVLNRAWYDRSQSGLAERPVVVRLSWIGATCGIPGVDVTEDYRGERRDVLALRGPSYSFTFGDYIVKCLVGVIDPQIHIIDMPPGSSIYGRAGGRAGGGGGCATQ